MVNRQIVNVMTPYEIDYKKLAVLLTPTFLRKSVFTAFIRVLMQPISTLHTLFRQNRTEHLFSLAHNGQVCYLKDALNTEFGLDYSNGFEIKDISAEGNFIFAYDETEWLQDTNRVWLLSGSPNYTMAYDEAAITAITETFIVYCPRTATSFTNGKPTDPRVASIVEQYRLVSRSATYRQK